MRAARRERTAFDDVTLVSFGVVALLTLGAACGRFVVTDGVTIARSAIAEPAPPTSKARGTGARGHGLGPSEHPVSDEELDP